MSLYLLIMQKMFIQSNQWTYFGLLGMGWWKFWFQIRGDNSIMPLLTPYSDYLDVTTTWFWATTPRQTVSISWTLNFETEKESVQMCQKLNVLYLLVITFILSLLGLCYRYGRTLQPYNQGCSEEINDWC